MGLLSTGYNSESDDRRRRIAKSAAPERATTTTKATPTSSGDGIELEVCGSTGALARALPPGAGVLDVASDGVRVGAGTGRAL